MRANAELLSIDVILAIHEEQLAAHGGDPGLRDRGLLESALARPQNTATYSAEMDVASIAAEYTYGIARNHPFVDGNKRAAFVALELCLALNGFGLEASDEDVVLTTLALASGNLGTADLAAWIRQNWRRY